MYKYPFASCRLGDFNENNKPGSMKLFNQRMYQSQMDENIDQEIIKYRGNSPYFNPKP